MSFRVYAEAHETKSATTMVGRQFEIVYMLINRRSVTAEEFARHFGVSKRTIYRDIDALSAAGIPVYAMAGKRGGILLLDNFILNRSMLSEEDQLRILSSLQSLNAVTPQQQNNETLDKLAALFGMQPEDWIETDFSGWDGDETFAALKTAILKKRVVAFDYYNSGGEKTTRKVEPLQLKFRQKSWYLYSWCHQRQDYRLFKLSRIRELYTTDETFVRGASESQPLAPMETEGPGIALKLLIDASQAYRVYDEFLEHQIECQEDGSFLVNVTYSAGEWVYGFILSFGDSAEVLEPAYVRESIRERLRCTLEKYEK